MSNKETYMSNAAFFCYQGYLESITVCDYTLLQDVITKILLK